jgi:acetolactate synthase-1/2/3 large subunit
MTDTPHKTGARFIAETLHGYGVTHVFYVDAILRRTLVELESLGIRRVVTHSEKAAAYIADGYARVSHRPGVCMAQSVGAANLAAGLQDAYLGCSPVIALTGRKPPLFQHRHAYQEIQHAPLFEPVTKYNVDVVTAEQLPLLLRQAFREATCGAPGPAHLDLAGLKGEVIEMAEGDWRVAVEETFSCYPAFRPQPSGEAVAQAARAIQKAECPVIVAGGGVRLSSAAPQVIALAEKLAAPVATSVNGKGSIPENHPLSVGVVGSYSRRCANQVVAEADLVISVGSRTGDQVTHNWTIPKPGTPVVQIDIDPAELGRSYPHTLGLLGDAQVTLRQLIGAVEPGSPSNAWTQRARALTQAWENEYEPLRRSDAVPIRPERLCQELGERAAGSLGWAFPAALGAKCAAPGRPVLCFTGDGGFWYHISELETARRCGIHTLTIVNNNGGFAQGIEEIQRVYGDRPGNPQELYRFGEVSLARIAQEMGCLGLRVTRPDEIAGAIREGLAADCPAVVEMVTDLDARAPAPWMPGDSEK